MSHFVEVSPEKVKDVLPSFYHKDDRYFEVIKNGNSIGFISIIPFIDGGCELGIYLTDKYRIDKNLVLEGINFPLSLGYDRVFISSSQKNGIKFLEYLKRIGMKYVCNMFGNRYYMKKLEV